MTDQTETTETLTYRVPATIEDMKPAKASSLITEAAAFLRVEEYFQVAKPFLLAISGESPSIHGSLCSMKRLTCSRCKRSRSKMALRSSAQCQPSNSDVHCGLPTSATPASRCGCLRSNASNCSSHTSGPSEPPGKEPVGVRAPTGSQLPN